MFGFLFYIISSVNFLFLYLILFIYFPIIYIGYHFLILRFLRSRGYDWIKISDVFVLYFRLKFLVWYLPHKDEVAVIPGYDDNREKLKDMILHLNGFSPFQKGRNMTYPFKAVQDWLDKGKEFPKPAGLVNVNKLDYIQVQVYHILRYDTLFAFIFQVPIFVNLLTDFLPIDFYLSFMIIFSPILFFLFFAQRRFLSNYFSALGYRPIVQYQTIEAHRHMRSMLFKIPKEKDLREFLELDEPVEFETLCRTMVTYQKWKKSQK